MLRLSLSRLPLATLRPLASRLIATRGFRTSYATAHHTTEPIGVEAVLQGTAATTSSRPEPTIFHEFALKDRVGVVSGGNRGLGLEMSLALCELGARIYALDLPRQPSEEFLKVKEYVEKMGEGRTLEYVQADVTQQNEVWGKVEEIGDKEGRMDTCVAAAGILGGQDTLDYEAKAFEKIIDVNCNGVFYTAQAVGRQMSRFGNGGSIVLIASMSGSITNRDHNWTAYNTSKSAVVQMARSMACELGPQRIRVNSLSPGHIYTRMTAALLDTQPELGKKWANSNPLGRLGRPDELRGVVSWLASDASTFCTGSDILVSGGHHAW
ncbi:sorbose reductase sou1 [Clavulina sp. PMI_390]|nr:sorbose reductase sou1 [Clavulina sp. PMI_390]